jgi:hypothetical protein
MKRSMWIYCFVVVMAIVGAGLIPVQQVAADDSVTLSSAAYFPWVTVGESYAPALYDRLSETEPVVFDPSLGFPIND